MIFLNSWILLGLSAILVPLFVHLFHRQRVLTVNFSSVSFIRGQNLQHSRIFRLRELLLLMIRMLIVLLLVVAFSRPVIEGFMGHILGNERRSQAILAILLDDSYSMGAGEILEQTPFFKAKIEAEKILDTMQEGDKGFIILTSRKPKILPAVPSNAIDLRNILDNITVSQNVGQIGEALHIARKKLGSISSLDKQIYILSDLQKNEWEEIDRYSAVDPLDKFFQYNITKIKHIDVNNASIDELVVSEGILFGNQPEQFVATYTNHSSYPIVARSVDLVVNGERRGSRKIYADPDESGTVEFNIQINKPGIYNGYVEIAEDDISADNRRYFTMSIPETYEVTLVGHPISNYFVKQALTPSGGVMTPVKTQIKPIAVLNSDLSDMGVLIVDGGASLTPAKFSSLKRYIASGGGLIIFLGSNLMNTDSGKNFFEDVFDSSIRGIKGSPGQRKDFERLVQADYEHSIFHFSEQSKEVISFNPVHIYTSYIIDTDSHSQIIAKFTDGTPAIIEGQYGSGRALLVATDIHPNWSNFAVKSMFVPFMHRSVRYLHPLGLMSGGSYLLGDSPIQSVVFRNKSNELALEYPSGFSERVQPRVTPSGNIVQLTNLAIPGIYKLRNENLTLRTFAVNRGTQESDLETLSLDHALNLVRNTMTISASSEKSSVIIDGEIREIVSDSYEIWKLIIFLVLVLLLAEYWISGFQVRPNNNEISVPG